MKNPLRLTAALIVLASAVTVMATDPVKLPYIVYGDEQKETPWIPSGYMGNTKAITMDPDCTDAPHTGKKCLKVEYKDKTEWGGVVWQNPANDWGDQDGGHNLTGATKLTFWAKGAKGGEKVTFGVGLLGSDKKFPDTAKAELKEVALKPEWTQYTIDLKDKDLTRIKSGFYWTLAAQNDGVTFYLDDIQFE